MQAESKIVWKGSFRTWLTLLGPTAVLASVAMGPGTIGSNLAAGSSTGFSMAWIVVLSALMSVTNLYIVGKLTAVTGLSLLEQFAKFFHPAVAWAMGSIMLLTLMAVLPFTGASLGQTFNVMFPAISPVFGMTICFCAIVYVYILGGGFRYVSLLCSVLVALMAVSFLVNAVAVEPDLGEIARGVFVPTLPRGYDEVLVALGLVTGSVSIVGSLFQGYSVRNAGWTAKNVPVMAWDVLIFAGFIFLIFSLSILVSGQSLDGKPVRDAAEAAVALEPITGPAARWIFAVGYFIATFTTLAAASFLGGYIFHDFFKWSLQGDIHEDKRFRIICTLLLASVFLSPLIDKLFPPIYLMIFATALFGIGTPPVLLFTLLMVRRKAVLGEHRIGVGLTAFFGFTVIVSFVGAYALFEEILSHMA